MTDRSGDDHPARQTRAATSRRRQSWAGRGRRQVVEKDAVGVVLDDVAYAFADVSLSSLPVLSYLLVAGSNEWAGTKALALVAWLAMVAGAALIRGGWVRPPATGAPGWVALSPRLVALRLGYDNAVVALAAYGGQAVAAAATPTAAVAVASLVGAVAVALFPRVAEWFYDAVGSRRGATVGTRDERRR